jgi:beta-phosphoglucomutase-like phosphatase (HAD superfamily)
MIKCVIFDFDGTIADSKAVFISVYNQIAEKYNYKHLESDQHQHLRMLTFNERCRYLRVPMYRIPFLAREFLAHYKNELRHIKLFDGMRGLLEVLHAPQVSKLRLYHQTRKAIFQDFWRTMVSIQLTRSTAVPVSLENIS